jgi:uncharacterized membrane protein YeaQ/YmgE (transglycosylase-associated protein family)
MQEAARTVFQYLLGNPVLYFIIAFIAGLAASKSVGYEGKAGFILYLIVGMFGLFVSQYVILFYGLQQYLDNVSEFRLFFDFIAAYIGSFVVAAIVHFIRPM